MSTNSYEIVVVRSGSFVRVRTPGESPSVASQDAAMLKEAYLIESYRESHVPCRRRNASHGRTDLRERLYRLGRDDLYYRRLMS